MHGGKVSIGNITRKSSAFMDVDIIRIELSAGPLIHIADSEGVLIGFRFDINTE